MAKKLVYNYIFDPANRQIKIYDNVSLKKLLLITNVTDNIILYNFADEAKGATSVVYDSTTEHTVITLEHDTTAMSATDNLQIFIEKEEVVFEPSETFVDPVSKIRISAPENLVDTDFEYGPQASKWETLQLVNNIPSAFSNTSDTTIAGIISIFANQGSDVITVTTKYEHGLVAGTPIDVRGLSSFTAEGSYLIQSIPAETTFTYRCRGCQPATGDLSGAYSSVIPGQFYSNSQLVLDKYDGLLSDSRNYIVTAPAGAGGGFYIDEVQSPDLNIVKNGIFYFTQDDSSNTNHRIKFARIDKFPTATTKQFDSGSYATSGTLTTFATNGTTTNVSASNNGFIYTSSTDIDACGTRWHEVQYEGLTQTAGEFFRRGLYIETLGLQVRVGEGGVIATSPDNLNWTEQTSGTSNNLHDIDWDGGFITVVGDSGTVLRSSDGVTWTQVAGSVSTVNYKGVKSNSAVLVIVGAGGVIRTSTDGGDNWTLRTTSGTQNLEKVEWSGTQWMAVGATGAVYTSPEATTWTLQGAVGTSNNLQDLIWDDEADQFLIVGASGTAVVSSDGSTFSTKSTGLSNTLVGVAYATTTDLAYSSYGLYVIIDTQGDGAYSEDNGDTWIAFSTGTGVTTTEVYWSGYAFNILQHSGANTTSVYFEATKAGWANIPSNQIQFGATGTVQPNDITWVGADNQFVLVGNTNGAGTNGAIFVSSGGTAWTEKTDANIPNEDLIKLVYLDTNSTYYFLTPDNLHSTTDGTTFATWTQLLDKTSITTASGFATDTIVTGGSAYNAGTNIPLTTITGDGTGALATVTVVGGVISDVTITTAGKDYAVGDRVRVSGGNGDAILEVATLGNGSNSTTATFKDINILGSKITLIGTNGVVCWSPDLGTTWEVDNVGTNVTLNSIDYDQTLEQQYIIVGEEDGSDPTIFLADQPDSWTRVPVANIPTATTALNQVIYDEHRYVAVGDDGVVITSYDGTHWLQYDIYGVDTDINFVGTFTNTDATTGTGDRYLYFGVDEENTSLAFDPDHVNEGGLWLNKEGLTEYTTQVYYTGAAPGTALSYTRIFVDPKTPKYLTYYCQTHGLSMKGNIFFDNSTVSKVYMMTDHENGFSTGTDFYIVNTVSPKVVEVLDPTATAPDGRPFVDTVQQLNINSADTRGIENANTNTLGYNAPEQVGNQLLGYKGSYELTFGADDVDYTQNTITFDEEHKLYNGAALYYYPMPGDKPIGGLQRGQVYYVQVVNSNTIKFHRAGNFPAYYASGIRYDKMEDYDYPVFLREWSFTTMRYEQSSEYDFYEGDYRYGCSHSISKDGKTCAVGSRFSDSGGGTNRGMVYIYELNTKTGEWEFKQRISGYTSWSDSDYFGQAVCLNEDATRLLIGSPRNDNGTTDAGSFYIYDRASRTSNSLEIGFGGTYRDFSGRQRREGDDFSENHSYQYLGNSLDMDDSGEWMIIGMPRANRSISGSGGGSDSGLAVVVQHTNFQTNHYKFGGSGSSYTLDYERIYPTDNTWSSSDYFGHPVRMSGDYNRVVVGAMRDDQSQSNSGSVYIFDRGNGNVWTQAQRLNSPAPSSTDYYGQSIAFSKDKEFIVVSAPRKDTSYGSDFGQVYVYKYDTGTSSYTYRQTIECPTYGTANWDHNKSSIHFGGNEIDGDNVTQGVGQGDGIAISYNGDHLVIGANYYDIADLGVNNGGSWANRNSTHSNCGAAFAFRLDENGTAYEDNGKFLSEYSNSDSEFGASIAISANGDELVIGSPKSNLRDDSTSTHNLGHSEWFSRKDAGRTSRETQRELVSVDTSTDELELPAAGYNALRSGDVVLYYEGGSSSVRTPHGGLSTGTKYVAVKNGSNKIKLCANLDDYYASPQVFVDITSVEPGTHYIRKMNRGGTFECGDHRLALVYRIYREEKDDTYRWSWRTMYWAARNWAGQQYYGSRSASDIAEASGYDLNVYGNNSFGLAGTGSSVGSPENIENSLLFHTYVPGMGYPRHTIVTEGTGYNFGGSRANSHNQGWSDRRTNRGCILPHTLGIRMNRGDVMINDKNRMARRAFYGPYGTQGDSNIAPMYSDYRGDNANPYVFEAPSDGRIRCYGNNYYWRNRNYERDVSNWQYDYNGSLFWMPLTTVVEKDTIYSPNHQLTTNDQLTFNVQSGEGIIYNNSTGWNTESMATLNNGTNIFVEVVDDNRYRIKTGVGNQPLRFLQLRGDFTFTGTVDNGKANSIYVDDHQLSENNKIIYTNEGTQAVGGLTNGGTFYVDIINGDRFALRSSQSVSFTGRASANTTAGATTNHTRISRLSITSDLVVGMEVDLIANQQTLTQNGKYIITNVNFTSAGSDSNYIDVDNQWGGTGSNLTNISFQAAVPSQQLTGTGVGQQAFEDQSSDFGVSDGGFKNTVIIDEKTLEINVPFKIRPTKKLFDTSTALNVSTDTFTIVNHFFVTGQKVIYSNNGGRNLGGLVDNTDYYVIQLDDDQFQIATSRQDALDGNYIDITSTTGVPENHTFTHANVSGRVKGAGELTIEADSRRIIGSQGITNVADTIFKRYFKVGDLIRVMDTNTSPATIHERTITAIKDDHEMLVDEAFTFSDSAATYFIDTLVYTRPDGYYLHRPFDGGMEIGSSKSPDGLICRQTRKYFRYQSGKGIQTSLAINFNPKITAKSMTYTQVVGDVYGNKEQYSVATAAGNTGWEFTGDATGSNLTITLKAGDELKLTSTTATDTLWIVSQTATSGLGSTYAYNYDIGVTNNGLTNGNTLTWDTAGVPAGTYYYISEQNPTAMRGEIQISDATDGAKNRIVVVTKYPHNINVGSEIIIADSEDAEFNSGSRGWEVINIVDDFTFQVDMRTLIPQATSARGFLGYHMKEWSNAAVRCGMFDFQNGFFFEFDGQDLYCVRRSSTQQMTGEVSVTKNSNEVTGVDTKFTSQVGFGDKVVIRGQTYKVVKVTSDTVLKIQPSYRGTTTSNVLISKTIDTKVAQTNWNIDKCDGTGKTGYNLDLTKIQMAYMDYSWYGAGKIRFGFKDQNGHVKYVHEFRHNNRLTESYFRSGNLPARYEIESLGIATHTPALFHWGTSVMMDGMFQDDDAYLFTAAGNLLKYTNQAAASITTSQQSFTDSIRIYSNLYNHYIVLRFPSAASANAQPGTYLYNDTLTGFLGGFFANGRPVSSSRNTRQSGSEWRAAMLYVEGTTELFTYRPIRTDLDNNRVPASTVFSAGAPAGEVNQIDTNIPIISIRLSPSVDSSIQGILGEREIINRMQLKLNAIDIQTTFETEVELRLNSALSSDSWYAVDSPSLSQLISHEKGDTVSGGLKVFTFRAAGGTGGGSETTTLDLSKLIDLGNSIQGGDGVFPNGPDVLTIVANIVDSSGVDATTPYTVSGKISWAESQA